MKKHLLIFALALSAASLKAMHLIGFQAAHRCLGNNVYELKFILYRDCAGSGANFDNPMQCAIYKLVGGDTSLHSSSQFFNPVIENITFPSGPSFLCVEKGTYTFSVTLPDSGDYMVVYQRCCLTVTLGNIISPNTQGFTVKTTIRVANTFCNATPLLADLPFSAKIFEPFTFTPTVQEADNDSLVFSFCGVENGGGPILQAPGLYNCDGALPTPPCSPPYDLVTFVSPPYSPTYPVNSSPPFSIHPTTGVITGIPQQLGAYLVGLCISEYRSGVLVNESRIAFVLNVWDGFIATQEIENERDFSFRQNSGELKIIWINLAEPLHSISILDTNGRVLSQKIVFPNLTQESLPLNELPSGVLFLRLEWSDGKTRAKPFVKG